MTSDWNRSSKSQGGRGRTALGCVLALLAQLALVADARAAEEADAAALSELKAAAYDAQEAAARAREAAEQAQAAVRAAQQPQAEVPAPAPAAAVAPAAATGPAASGAAAAAAAEPVPTTAAEAARIEELERATAEARAAADAARRALKELQEQKRQHRMRYARRGFYLGGGAFYAPQHFDAEPIKVKSSRGLYGQVGYRVHPHVGLDLRYDWLEGFEVSYWDVISGEVDGWMVSGNLQLFLLTGSFQPYAAFGLGVIRERELIHRGSFVNQVTGEIIGPYTFDQTYTEAAMRIGAGIDYYLSETVALNVDAAFVAPGGDELKYNDHATLSAGIKLRF